MHPTHSQGAASEYRAAAWFSLQGWEVYWSNSGQSAVDFIVMKDNDVQTVQVKTAVKVPKGDNPIYLKVNLTRGRNKGQLYADNAFDLLAVSSTTYQLWIIPFSYLPVVGQFSIWNANKSTGYEQWLVTK